MRGKRVSKPNLKPDYLYEIPKKRTKEKSGESKVSHPDLVTRKPKNVQEKPANVSSPVSPLASPLASPTSPLTPQIAQTTATQTLNDNTNGQTDSKNNDVEEALNKLYTSLTSPAAFSAALEQFVSQKRSLSLHKKRRKIFPRRKFITHQANDLIMGDLIFYEGFKSSNDNFKYLLTVIDTFSRKAWIRPLKSKSAEAVAQKLDEIIATMKRPPRKFCSDQVWFLNTHVVVKKFI